MITDKTNSSKALTSQFNAYILTLLIPSTILSFINADLGPSPNYPWITISWTLCASIIISVGGRLSDIFGRRYFILFGACVSFTGTIVGATGQSINQMIASGVIFGIGSGFQEMVSTAYKRQVCSANPPVVICMHSRDRSK